MQAWRWDLFCRVIDNFGDVGVCWRLAAALGARGHALRLYIDDVSSLAWLAPQGAAGVQVLPWPAQTHAAPPGDVVVEAFGCTLPHSVVAAMAARPMPPVWINLEYLSAEPYVERCHGLRSPQLSGPGAGLDKWFFYPGFTPSTGGLLHALPALVVDTASRWGALPGQRRVLLFGYANPALPSLLAALANQPTLLWLPPGPLRDQLASLPLPANVRQHPLPWLAQPEFDQLLAAADLLLVRGEDSFVRAQLLGGGPMLWHVYPQHDGAHAAKLDAWLALHLAGCTPALADQVRQAQRVLNGLAAGPLVLPEPLAWRAAHLTWQAKLRAQTDQVSRLLAFVTAKLGRAPGESG